MFLFTPFNVYHYFLTHCAPPKKSIKMLSVRNIYYILGYSLLLEEKEITLITEINNSTYFLTINQST